MISSIIRRLVLRIKYRNNLSYKQMELKPHATIQISGCGKIEIGSLLLNSNVFLCSSDKGVIEIGDNVSINRNGTVVIKEHLKIGDGTSIGPNVSIYDHDHYFDKDGFAKSKFTTRPICIGQNVWIGANVVILKGSSIGDNSVIGAGTVIKGEIPNNSIVTATRELHIKQLQ